MLPPELINNSITNRETTGHRGTPKIQTTQYHLGSILGKIKLNLSLIKLHLLEIQETEEQVKQHHKETS